MTAALWIAAWIAIGAVVVVAVAVWIVIVVWFGVAAVVWVSGVFEGGYVFTKDIRQGRKKENGEPC
jgi:hypothetical protein